MDILMTLLKEEAIVIISEYFDTMCPHENYIPLLEARIACCMSCKYKDKCPTGRENIKIAVKRKYKNR